MLAIERMKRLAANPRGDRQLLRFDSAMKCGSSFSRLPDRVLVKLTLMLSIGILLTLCIPLVGQQGIFHVDVKVVNVLATVRDQDGHLVSNLTRDDFLLEEDGRPQTIKYFSRQSDYPLALGLMVDTSLSQHQVLDRERNANYRFLARMIRPNNDSAFILRFDEEVGLSQNFTSSKQKLEKALHHVRERGTLSITPSIQRGCGFRGTTLYDAVVFAAKSLMKSREGRKALLLLTDGVDVGSCQTLDDAIRYAQRSDTMIYAIFFSGEDSRSLDAVHAGQLDDTKAAPYRASVVGRKVLRRITGETGGRFFEFDENYTIEQIYTLIEEELRNQYNLGFSSDQKGTTPQYRKVRVTVRRPGLVVQARDGYYAE